MLLQDFIFYPGIWLGEGKISFSSSPDFLKFYTKWVIVEKGPHEMEATQTVEIIDVEEHVTNIYHFREITPSSFTVFLENQLLGSLSGAGLREGGTIAWEYQNQSVLRGFEVYEKQENGDYFLHAEYGSSEHFRTLIEGLIWQKSTQS